MRRYLTALTIGLALTASVSPCQVVDPADQAPTVTTEDDGGAPETWDPATEIAPSVTVVIAPDTPVVARELPTVDPDNMPPAAIPRHPIQVEKSAESR